MVCGGQKLEPEEIVAGLLQREQAALGAGFTGLRTNGNCAWVSPDQWNDFQEYESLVHKVVRGRRMICMCSYCMDQFHDDEYQGVMARHDMVVQSALRSPARGSRSNAVPVDVAPERQKRIFDLAMTASLMGTWRYTLADNICLYDENAQRLYGLTEARFLHDEEGVKAKFHPDDMDPMWSKGSASTGPERRRTLRRGISGETA